MAIDDGGMNTATRAEPNPAVRRGIENECDEFLGE